MRVRRSKSGIGSLSLTAAAGLRGPMTTAVDENGFYDVLRGFRRVMVIGDPQ